MQNHFRALLLLIWIVFSGQMVLAQKDPTAKKLMEAAVADSVAKQYELAGEGFLKAARQEMSIKGYDANFAANCFHRGAVIKEAFRKYQDAHENYYNALEQYRKGLNYDGICQMLKSIASLYKETSTKNVVFNFPKSTSMETITANRSITSLAKMSSGEGLVALIDGGSNDGIYEGAEAEVLGRHKSGQDRSNRLLGYGKVIQVYPNQSRVRINLINPRDSFYTVYTEDMVALPIRFPRLPFKDIFLEVSLLNIKFLDNSREPLAHPRTLMYYAGSQLEAEVYERMLDAVKEIYDMIKDDTAYNPTEKITRGRLAGVTWKQAMGMSRPGDLKAFLGFVRSFPGKYMGGSWKISETYATWLLNNAPPGANEIMDSLKARKDEKAFTAYVKAYYKDIRDNFFETWLVDAQKMAIGDRFAEAKSYAHIIEKVATIYNDPDMRGWSYFNWGRIQDEEKSYDSAIINYNKGKGFFEKGTDPKGLSFCINNLATIYNAKFRYKEAQDLFEQVVKLRLQKLQQDTSEDQKTSVSRGYWGLGDALFNQSKYKEAIEQYLKGIDMLKNTRSLDALKQQVNLNKQVGKSYENMGEYLKAASYYEYEYATQLSLGDVEAQADALDNQAYLISKLGKYRESYAKYKQAYDLHLKAGEKNDAGFSMSNIGQVLWSLGSYDSAIQAHNLSISLRKETGNKKGEANSWKKLGGLYKASGDAAKSLESYRTSLDIYKQLDSKSDYGELLEELGAQYVKMKDYANSDKYYKEALKLYKDIKSRNKEADVLSSLGDMFYSQRMYLSADSFFTAASVIQKEINDRTGLMYSSINRGLVAQFAREDYKDAIVKMRQGLMLAEETGSQSNRAYCESRIGSLYSYISEYDSAARYYDLALNQYRKLEDQENVADLFINYGYYYNYRGDFERARAHFDSALVIGRNINNAYTIASSLYGISAYQSVKGEFNEALKSIGEVLKIYQEKENPWGIASVYLDQANIYNDLGEYEEALQYYFRTDSMYKLLKLEKPQISVTNNIGTIYYFQHNYPDALKQFEKVQKMLEKNNDDPVFQALIQSNIGEVLLDQKKFAESEKYLVRSLQMGVKQKNTRQLYLSHMIYGRLLSEQKKYDLAIANYTSADSILAKGGEKKSKVQLLESWGRTLYLQGKAGPSSEKLLECIALSKAIQYYKYSWKAYSTLADIRFAEGREAEGILFMDSSIREVEKIKTKISGAGARKIFASDDSIVELYKKMIVYLKKQGRVQEALVYMEKANAENVNLRLNSDDITYTDAGANEAAQKEKELRRQQAIYDTRIAAEKAKPENLQHKEQIAQLEKMRSITAEQYKSYVNELKVKYPNLQAFKTVDPTEFIAQRRKIPQDVAVVSYLVTETEMSVFVVMKDTLFIKDIPVDKNRLQQKIRNFYAQHARSGKSVRDARGGKLGGNGTPPVVKEDKNVMAEELYDILVAPLMGDLKNKDRVAIVPSGLLCFVPFDALIKKDKDGSITYFGEQKQLFYVNKITTVTSGNMEPMSDFRILAAGNADKSLPNAEKEVKALQTLMPNTTVYVREAATKKNIIGNKGDFNVLHLATHGVLDYANADSSYLIFASDPANNDDGRLTIKEIQSTLDFDRFGIIMLSACETAVIREVAEGWPISMGTAFIEMGVPSVVATLWQVDDNATSILMQQFYSNLKTMDKVKALQQAQAYLRKQPGYDDPYFWAPFQLVGVWK